MAKKRLTGYSSSKTGRQSQGAGQLLLGKGGLGYIARRGIDFGTSMLLQSVDGLARLAVQQPLELLSLLPDIVPEVGLAAWNGLRLACGPDNIRIKAMTVGAPGAVGKSKATDNIQRAESDASMRDKRQETAADGGSEEAPDGTAAIANLFDNLPNEVGTFHDALARCFLTVLFSGMCACEAVPGPRNTGLAAVWPINSLTLRFKREEDGRLALYQKQTAQPSGIGIYSTGFGGVFEPMPMERFFWSALDGFPDDPYGRAPFSAALNEVIRMLAFMDDLLLAFHRVGMPKYAVSFDFEHWATMARDLMGMNDDESISTWVMTKFNEAQGFFNDLGPDDAFFYDVKGDVKVVGSGAEMPPIQQIFDIVRWRLIIALKQNPVLMGFVNGSTETWSDVQWEIYSKGMLAVLNTAVNPLVDAANLHLQLLGMPYKAVAEIKPIRSIQRMTDAQAQKIEIENAARQRDEGWISQDTAAMEITGSAPVSQVPVWRNVAAPTEQITEQVPE